MTVSIIDRYLELKQVRRSKLQLVGVSSLLVSCRLPSNHYADQPVMTLPHSMLSLKIAAKYEEIYPPELRDLVYITDRAYTKQEILEMESEMEMPTARRPLHTQSYPRSHARAQARTQFTSSRIRSFVHRWRSPRSRAWSSHGSAHPTAQGTCSMRMTCGMQHACWSAFGAALCPEPVPKC